MSLLTLKRPRQIIKHFTLMRETKLDYEQRVSRIGLNRLVFHGSTEVPDRLGCLWRLAHAVVLELHYSMARSDVSVERSEKHTWANCTAKLFGLLITLL